MTCHLTEATMRTRIHALAETLPVDAATGWDAVGKRRAQTTKPLRHGLAAKPSRRRVRRPLLVGLAASIVVAAGVGVLIVGTGPASGTPTLPAPLPFTHGSHESAVALLGHAATLQLQAGAVTGPVEYAKTQNYALETGVVGRTATTTVETTIREVRIAGDGSAVATTAIQDTTRAGQPVGPPSDQTTDSAWHDINAHLPSAPDELAAALLGADATGSEKNLILAQQVMAHLAQGTTTPAQTSSMYALLASLPGVFAAGTVTDNDGRTGNAVGVLTGHFDAGSTCTPATGTPASINATLSAAHALGNGITYLVLDPATGNPLEIEQVDIPNAPCGLRLPAEATIGQYNVILETRS